MIHPVIFGLAGTQLNAAEKKLLSQVKPAGFIFFNRNIEEPRQLKELIESICQLQGTKKRLFLIDQEGGRVSRLKPPHWRLPPPAKYFGDLAQKNPVQAKKELENNAYLIAKDLHNLGLNTVCAPVLDLIIPGQDPIIGDRAFGEDPHLVAKMGRWLAEAYLAQGILPIIKHIPGHGRACVDSHHLLPQIPTDLQTLIQSDFIPFQSLADMPMAMTGHVQLMVVDAKETATTSRSVIQDIIRHKIGFKGILLSDDIAMKALSGSVAERTKKSLQAGCQLILHCNGKMDEIQEMIKAAGQADLTTQQAFEQLWQNYLPNYLKM